MKRSSLTLAVYAALCAAALLAGVALIAIP